MKIFIGYDSKQHVASEVCKFSIDLHSRYQIDTVDLKLADMKEAGYYFRQDQSPNSTEFTYIRFLVPFLNNYTGWSLFVDSDFIFTRDVTTILDDIMWDPHSSERACYVVKHPEYTPKSDTKFYGHAQYTFPKKNWSSLILFNNEHPSCRRLNPMSVSNRSPQWLHRFNWCDESEVHGLDPDWNFLVGEHEPGVRVPKGIHFTNGGPFNGVWGQDYEEFWLHYYEMQSGSTFPHSSVDFKV